MGTCVKCGRETTNSYEYCSALTSRSKSISGGTVTYTATHRDVTKHSSYFCTRCVWLKLTVMLLVFAAVFLAAGILATIAPAGGSTHNPTAGIVFLVIAVLAGLIAVHGIIMIKGDRRCRRTWTAGQLISVNKVKQMYPGRELFVGGEFGGPKMPA